MGSQARWAMVGAALVSLLLPLAVEQPHANASARTAERPAVRTVRAVPVTTVRRTAAPSCPAGLVALTFDDGPARGLTVRLVESLERLHVPATFFMVGSRIRTAPYAARVVARAGFMVGNHTWSHSHLTRLSDSSVRSEIRRTAAILRRQRVPKSPLMRPPYGDINPRVRADVHRLGLVPVLWDVDSNDWRGGSTAVIAASILAQLRPHESNIVLQHDGVRNSPASVAAVPRVVRTARQRGYCFTTLGPDGRMVPLEPATDGGDGAGPAATTGLRARPSFDVSRLPGDPVSGA